MTTPDRLQWWREARFGMFIHWGLYSVPAGIWRGRETPGIGEWLMAHFKIPLAEYRKFATQFNPVKFDADQIVMLAKEAGMKYIVITAKHHDGFAMWDSQVSDYNIVKATPYHHDPLRDLADACTKHGLRLCFYYSQDLDWEHPDGGFNDWDYDPSQKNFSRYLEQKVKPQLRELLTGYGPIGLIWCDTPMTIQPAQSRDLKRFIQSIQPDCLVSGRVGHGVGDYESLGDNTFPMGRLTGAWETPATLNKTWGYKVNDQHWKSTETVVQLLVDLASKGVNYLLNIGPTAAGEIPQPSIERLKEIGTWWRVNGEAIFGSQASPFPYEFDWGRVTQKPGKLYFFFSQPPGPVFRLAGLHTRVRTIRNLADGAAVPFHQTDTLELHFTHPPGTLELQLDGPAVVDTTLTQQSAGQVVLPAHMAEFHIHAAAEGSTVSTGSRTDVAQGAEQVNTQASQQFSLTPNGLTQNWHSPADWLAWEFRVVQPGAWTVQILTVAPKYQPWQGGHHIRVTLGNQGLTGVIRPDRMLSGVRTEHYSQAVTDLGTMTLTRPGIYWLELHAVEINSAVPTGLCVCEIRLTPTLESSATA